MASTLAGDPAALRAAAAQLRHAAQNARTAADRVRSGRDTARGGWQGQAATAFDTNASGVEQRVHYLEHVADAAAPLEEYATALEQAQQAYAQAFSTWSASAYPQQSNVAATQAMGQAQQAAQAANQRAAAQISRIAASFADGLAFEQAVRTQFSTVVGNGISAVGAGQGIAQKLAEQRLDPGAATAAGDDVAAATRLGNGLAFVGPAAGQILKDADDPQYSVAERAGRTAMQSATVGVGALGGAEAGLMLGAALGSVVPGLGTVAGGVIGFGLGALGGYLGSSAVDATNDDAVDWAGKTADDAADATGDVIDDVSPW